MKKLLSVTVLVFITFTLMSQAPQAFKYQAIARDAQGNVLVDQHVSIDLNILKNGTDGISVYNETHQVQTNSFGLINLSIGKGEIRSGDFSQIDWGADSYFISIGMDGTGGSNYKQIGTSELLSVPYALYAGEISGNNNRAGEWTNDGTNIYTDETVFPSANTGIGTTVPGGKLHIYGPGLTGPNAPMLFVQHEGGFSSTFRRNTNSPGNALFLLQKSRGTRTAPTVVQNGDNIGQIRMEAYDGTDYKTAGWIRVAVDGTPSSGIVPGAVLFATTDNTGSVTERMRITSNGNVGIGTIDPAAKLDVLGTFRYDDGLQANGKVLASDATGLAHWVDPSAVSLWDLSSGDLFSNYTDVVIEGSLGVGFDVVPGVNFGFSTILLSENNLRITFDDSSIGGFPSNDWQLTANDSQNGGESYFGIEDLTAATMPFMVMAGATDSALIVAGDGNIGVGTKGPQQKVDVIGIVNATDFYKSGTPIKEGVWNSNASNIYYTAGNVGIGTTSPNTKFELVGNANIYPHSGYDGRFRFLSGGGHPYLLISDNADIGKIKLASNGDSYFTAGNLGVGVLSPGYKLEVSGNINATNYYKSGSPLQEGVWNTNGLRIYYNNGCVGIGTTNPQDELDVNIDLAPAWIRVKSGNNYSGLKIDKGASSDNGYIMYKTAGNTDWYVGTIKNNDYSISTDYDPSDGSFYIERSTLNVGIGTVDPAAQLQVVAENEKAGYFKNNASGGIPTATLYAENTNTGAGIAGHFQNEGTDYTLILSSNGSGGFMKGFGSNGGEDEFRINDDGSIYLFSDYGTRHNAISLLPEESSTDGAAIKMYNSTGELTIELDADISDGADILLYNSEEQSTVNIDGDASNAGQIELWNATQYETIAIDGDYYGGGAIFIKDETGGSAITLSADYLNTGDSRIITDELQINGGSDIAEPFDVMGVDELLPGTVLTLDKNNPGKLKVAEKEYDKCVIGIVSGAGDIETGLILQQIDSKADGEHPVAISGRVYCLADASYDKIEVGDMLTTSNTPGYARKATDFDRAQGAIIGKAMSSLEDGKGLVFVFVTLQ